METIRDQSFDDECSDGICRVFHTKSAGNTAGKSKSD